VAHNLNDKVETMFFNLARGTGIKGVVGIAPVRDNIIRPILCLTRNEIEDYLATNNVEYRTDSTNLKEDYSRNKIRNRIIPYFESEINAGTVMNMSKFSEELSEIEDILAKEADKLFEKYVAVSEQDSEKECLMDNGLTAQKNIYIRRVIRKSLLTVSGRLKDITRQHVESVQALFDNNTGAKINLPYGMVACKTYTGVKIIKDTNEGLNDRCKKCTSKKEDDIVRETTIFENGSVIDNKLISLKLYTKWTESQIKKDLLYTKMIDCDKIKGKLVVRTRKQGDYIRLDGSSGDKEKYITKKIKQYFINEKISKQERDSVLLVADGDEIVWIVGHRLSAAYKVTDKTKKVLQLDTTIHDIREIEEKNGREDK
ncbi:MAG: tRNA lysidine(34) synthetase TilS, partial [Lachnospiraceae bacterium]|nr:tRNA lysidine(34) synthetase TilS [Lachnospiraceae bacterium]